MDKQTYECPSPPDDFYHWEEKSWVTPGGLAGAILPSASRHLDPITTYDMYLRYDGTYEGT